MGSKRKWADQREREGEWPQHCMTGRPCKVGVNGGWWVMSGGLSMKKGPQYDLMQGMQA